MNRMDRNKEKTNNQRTWTREKNKAPKQVHPSKAKPMTKVKKSTQMGNGTETRSHCPISPHPSTLTRRFFFFVCVLLLSTSTSGTPSQLPRSAVYSPPSSDRTYPLRSRPCHLHCHLHKSVPSGRASSSGSRAH